MRDYGLSMRRSFRVGWSRDGRIVHPGKIAIATVKGSRADNGDDTIQDEVSRTQQPAAAGGGRKKGTEDIVHGTCHRVYVEKLETLRWFHSVEEELGISSSLEQLVERPMLALLQACELDHRTAWLVPDQDEMKAEATGYAETDAPNRLSSIAPLWRLPSATLEDLPRYTRFLVLLRDLGSWSDERRLDRDHPDWSIGAAISLFSAACGQEEHVTQALHTCTREMELQGMSGHMEGEMSLGYDHLQVAGVNLANTLLPMYEAREDVPITLWEMRREALSAWLEQVVASASRADLLHDPTRAATESPSTVYNDIFELLCCHRIEDAVSLAQMAGLYRLATLLSQTDGDVAVVKALRQQVQQWYLTGFEMTVPRELLDVYCLISGKFVNQSVAEKEEYHGRDTWWSESIFAPTRRAVPLRGHNASVPCSGMAVPTTT